MGSSKRKKSKTSTKKTASHSAQTFRFLDLPSELRVEIYRLIIAGTNRFALLTRRSEQPEVPPLLCISKQIRKEAAPLYYFTSNKWMPTFYGDFDLSNRGHNAYAEPVFYRSLRRIMGSTIRKVPALPPLELRLFNIARTTLRSLALIPSLFCDPVIQSEVKNGWEGYRGAITLVLGDADERDEAEVFIAMVRRLLVRGREWRSEGLPPQEVLPRVWKWLIEDLDIGCDPNEDAQVRNAKLDLLYRTWGLTAGKEPTLEWFLKRQDLGLV